MSTSVPTFTTNATEVTAKLGAGGAKLENPRSFLEQCRHLLTQQEADVWASDGSALEGAWKQIVQPERKVGSHLLVESGDLLHSMSDPSAGRVRGNTLRIHPKPRYGFYHQFGSANMEARPFSGISESTAREIQRLMQAQTERDLGV